MIDSILDFLLFFVVPFFRRRKQRREEWIGFLEKLKEGPAGPLAKHQFRAIFRTDDGKKITIWLRKQDANRYQKGIRYRKKSGEDFPEPFA